MSKYIEVKDLSLIYGRKQALKSITFSLGEGKIYGLLGRNGAGKTSLLSLFASFRQPTSGTIRIEGEDPFENERIMQKVALIYNRDFTYETEKVKGLFEFAKAYRPNFNEEYAKYLVERFKLPLNKPVYKLSKGQQSAVNAAIGLASRAPITIFDEAYSGMDAPTRDIFYKEVLKDQAQYPRTIILSTHLVSEMDYLFDEVLVIHEGKLLLHEEYESLISKGASVTGEAKKVDQFVQGKKKLNEQTLGPTKSAMIYGELSDRDIAQARALGLEVGPVKLQDLFIYLTEEGE